MRELGDVLLLLIVVLEQSGASHARAPNSCPRPALLVLQPNTLHYNFRTDPMMLSPRSGMQESCPWNRPSDFTCPCLTFAVPGTTSTPSGAPPTLSTSRQTSASRALPACSSRSEKMREPRIQERIPEKSLRRSEVGKSATRIAPVMGCNCAPRYT